ncbi:hypothetical protein D9611_002011 [Ephemerocybe angulata]|uniref:Uncharacterized protein n=1 Tax=Ephemerocybe angulata TaxID=980116 RepID=A0A8H5CHV1_9AGAR|nr:hypothetical protein D9611_002011 [Tulosesus angulatus]
MLQCVPNATRRAVHNVRFSGPSISTRAPGLLVARGVLHGCFLNTVSTPRKTHASIQVLRPVSTCAVQRDPARGRRKRTVNNLDPKHLSMSDMIDLHALTQPSLYFGATRTRIIYSSENIPAPFPPNSRGFLYYHSRPGLPASTGEIRFRVVDSRTASHSAADLFANGNDLLDHTGRKPWRIHMLQLYIAPRTYDPIRRLLLSQGLIGEAQDRETEQGVSVNGMEAAGKSTIIDTISDTFVIQLPILKLRLVFIHDECIVPALSVGSRMHWRDRPETVEGSDARWRVYQGAAVVRFELKKAEPNMFHNVKDGEVRLVLRILELLDPMDPDGVPYRLSEGGELVQGRSPNWSWSTSLDRAQRLGILTPSSLKILKELYLRDSGSTKTTATGERR